MTATGAEMKMAASTLIALTPLSLEEERVIGALVLVAHACSVSHLARFPKSSETPQSVRAECLEALQRLEARGRVKHIGCGLWVASMYTKRYDVGRREFY